MLLWQSLLKERINTACGASATEKNTEQLVLWSTVDELLLEVLNELIKATKILFVESFQFYTGRKLKRLNVSQDLLPPPLRWKCCPFLFWQIEWSKDLRSYGYSKPLVGIQYG